MDDINKEDIDASIDEFLERFKKRRAEKGKKPFASEHEVLGKLLEEGLEFAVGIWKRDDQEEKILELEDIAITAVWGIISYKAGMRQKKKKKEDPLPGTEDES